MAASSFLLVTNGQFLTEMFTRDNIFTIIGLFVAINCLTINLFLFPWFRIFFFFFFFFLRTFFFLLNLFSFFFFSSSLSLLSSSSSSCFLLSLSLTNLSQFHSFLDFSMHITNQYSSNILIIFIILTSKVNFKKILILTTYQSVQGYFMFRG